MRRSSGVKGVSLFALLIIATAVWYAAVREDTRGRLTVSYWSEGKGSAVFVEAPSGEKVLIDGGPDAGVLRSLGGAIPLYDRSFDLVVAATPDQNHIGGLVDVLERYHTRIIVQPGGVGSSPIWDSFETEAAAFQTNGSKILTARRGQVYELGGGAFLEVLYPDRLVAGASASEDCVVARLVYGDTSFLFACAASAGVQKYLAMLDGSGLKSDVLAMSATPSPIFLGYVAPSYVASSSETFISDGRSVSLK